MATDAQALAMGFVLPADTDPISQGAEAIRTNARAATERFLTAGSGVLSGSGRPEGSVHASPGTMYVDTNTAAPVRRWFKATGTGPTGWIHDLADSGRRDIKAQLDTAVWAAPTSANPEHITFRRIGDTVSLVWRLKVAAGKVGTARNLSMTGLIGSLSAIGAPGDPATLGMGALVALGYLGPAHNMASATRLDVNLATAAGNWGANDVCTGFATWTTIASWPTSLPGIAL